MLKILIFVLAFAYTSFVMASQKDDALNAALSKCKVSMFDKRLDSLRGNVYIWEHSGLKPLDQLNRYPTMKERKALAILYDLHLQCMTDFQAIEPNTSDEYSPLLANLRDGKITYADLKEWQDRQSKKNRAELDVALEKIKDKNLSCILESPDYVAGVEIQYTFNESSNKLWASRGEKPEAVIINDSAITYRTDVSGESGAYEEASISRNTGRLTFALHSPGGRTSFIVGACHAANEHKF